MQKTITYQQQQFAYERFGEGSPLVLIHGFGEDAAVWQGILPELVAQYSCFIIHLPGTGLNADAPIRFCTIAAAAELVGLIIKAEQMPKVNLLGHSMGGYIALALAQQEPALVAKLALLHSTVFADSETKIAARNKNIEFLQTHGASTFLKQTTPNLFAAQYVNQYTNWLQEYIASISYLKPEVLIAYTASMRDRPSSEQWVKQTNIPIMYIAGEQDNAVPLANSLAQSHLPNISYFHILKNVGHMGMWESKMEVVELIVAFQKMKMSKKI